MTKIVVFICSFFLTFTLTGCTELNQQLGSLQINQQADTPTNMEPNNQSRPAVKKPIIEIKTSEQQKDKTTSIHASIQTPTKVTNPARNKKPSNAQKDAIQVVAKPESIPVLVNKKNKLPDAYKPRDLIYTTIPFIFKGKSEKREMRKEASTAISNLFAGAKKQGVNLLGVSAYRSHATQTALFNAYVKKDGYAKARIYSALPGTSEHETGLAIDVTGGNGKCSAEDCFGGTKEAKWLQAHVAEYGFIIRYPKGKDLITGYKYEPWHLRYVGKVIAKEIMSGGSTLEEYYNTIPVSK
jgi:zinc D-Ala-D-Ala carboxypeptidase